MLITCDYLEVYLRGNFTGENTSNFQFGQYPTGTGIYNERWYVSYCGVHFGTLLCKPRMRTMQSDAVHFKVDNEQLYTMGTNSVLVHFLRETGLRFQSVTRLDVACDFQQFSCGITPQDLVVLYLSGALQRIGKGLTRFTPYYKTINGQLTFHALDFGSRTSERSGKLYNKTLELQEKNKPYITAWHEKNGLVGADVWRLEFTLRGRELKKLFRPTALCQDGRANLSEALKKAISSEQVLLVSEILAGIFQTELLSYFTFVPGGSVKEKSKRKPLVLLDFAKVNPRPELILRIGVKRSATSKVERYKRAVKTLLMDYYISKQETYLYVACQFIQKYNLHRLVAKRFDYWYKEFAPFIDERYKYVSVLDMLDDVPTAE